MLGSQGAVRRRMQAAYAVEAMPAPVKAAPLVGQSEAMNRLRGLIGAVGPRDATVLVQGPSGSGKELVARHLHLASKRAAGPFVAVDCTGLRDTLLESQLFGHVKGAFTGADQATLGFFRSADGGTLFLDEIGELDLKTQAKLLRCIQERAVVPLGAVHPVPVNVRVICATHRDLRAMVARGDFREDLFFRLDVVKLSVPAMSERPDDAVPLARHFLAQLADLYEEPAKVLSPEAEAILAAYPWPGNVRELGNAIEHAVVFATGEVLTPADLPERLRAGAIAAANHAASVAVAGLSQVDGPIVTLEAAEKALIARALRSTRGNQSAAAQMLRIDRRRLHRKVERYSLLHLLDGGEG